MPGGNQAEVFKPIETIGEWQWLQCSPCTCPCPCPGGALNKCPAVGDSLAGVPATPPAPTAKPSLPALPPRPVMCRSAEGGAALVGRGAGEWGQATSAPHCGHAGQAELWSWGQSAMDKAGAGQRGAGEQPCTRKQPLGTAAQDHAAGSPGAAAGAEWLRGWAAPQGVSCSMYSYGLACWCGLHKMQQLAHHRHPQLQQYCLEAASPDRHAHRRRRAAAGWRFKSPQSAPALPSVLLDSLRQECLTSGQICYGGKRRVIPCSDAVPVPLAVPLASWLCSKPGVRGPSSC
jgi:hypothetical protein